MWVSKGSKMFFELDEYVYICNVCLLLDCNPTDSKMRELQGRFELE